MLCDGRSKLGIVGIDEVFAVYCLNILGIVMIEDLLQKLEAKTLALVSELHECRSQLHRMQHEYHNLRNAYEGYHSKIQDLLLLLDRSNINE